MSLRRTFTNNLRSQAHVRTDGRASDYDHGGRHELLRTSVTHSALYDYIKDNPDCTRADACDFVVCNWRRVTDLINEGLVYESGRKSVSDGRMGRGGAAKTLRVAEGTEGGRKRDLVHVEVVVSVNEFGEYSCEAKIIGQQPGATEGRKIQVLRKMIAVRVPKPSEFKRRIVVTVKDAPVIDIEPQSVVLDESLPAK